ncbi:MAG: hypothetical protein H6819_05030 [Phycisphaerales bacterium]|nr:hypothetical protein [Phycisphaerales bacterium]MCB9854857.1 hypothetical protein [Phycisphaerales bacterium]
MNVFCPQCGAKIPADDMNLSTMAAKCRACQALFSLGGVFEESDERARHDRRVDKNVPQPKSIRVDESGSGLRIIRRWYSPLYFFMVFFCIAWDGFLVFWYYIALTKDAPWIMSVFPVLHVAVGVGLTYWTIAGFVNRTEIVVDSRELSVAHRPMPWFGALRMPVEQIDQLYCKQKISRGENGTSVSYELFASKKGGGKRKILSGLMDSDHALFVERRVESYLGIRDRRVAGEFG